MTSSEYEEVVKNIVAAIVEQVEGEAAQHVGYGRSNTEEGKSGYNHQIDVSVKGSENWLLVECKCWAEEVDVERFLAFLMRIIDILPSEPSPSLNIHASFVTTIGVQPGVEQLADYYRDIYNIRVDIVRSPAEFAIKYKHLFAIGVAGDLNQWKDNAEVVLGDVDGRPL